MEKLLANSIPITFSPIDGDWVKYPKSQKDQFVWITIMKYMPVLIELRQCTAVTHTNNLIDFR